MRRRPRLKINGRRLNSWYPRFTRYFYDICDINNPEDPFTRAIDPENPLSSPWYNEYGPSGIEAWDHSLDHHIAILKNNPRDNQIPDYNPRAFINPLTGRYSAGPMDFT